MATKEKKTYTARPNSPFPKSAASAIGRRLETIRKQHGDVLKPEHVVADAKAEASPLHAYFEWDNSKAAHEHRLAQARRIIGAVEVIVIVEDKETSVRQFHNVVIKQEDDTDPVRGYVPLERIEADTDLREQVVNEVIETAEYFLRKYRGILDSCGVADDFERVIKKLRVKAA